MQRSWRRCAVVLAGVLTGAALCWEPALARINDKNWEAGGYVVDSHYNNSAGINDVFTLGGRAGYFFSAANGLELDFDKGSSNGREFQSINFDVSKTSLNYVHNMTLKGKEKTVPLVFFGFGKIKVDDGGGTASRNFLGGGAGVRYFYTPRLALRVDGTIYRWRGDGTVVKSAPFYSFDIKIGVSYVFGAAK